VIWRSGDFPSIEVNVSIGFRVASIPEPNVLLLAAFALLAGLLRPRQLTTP
jgi:hypothetical protein